MQVRGEICRGIDDAGKLLGAQIFWRQLGPHRAAARRVQIPRALVERGDAGALLRVRHDQEVPALRVRSRRRLERDFESTLDDGRLDRTLQVETLADGAGGGEQLVGELDVHGGER
jgi:hypothetical protein